MREEKWSVVILEQLSSCKSTEITTATKTLEYLNITMEKCKEQWNKITQLEMNQILTTEEREKLKMLKHCFTLTISGDYQQSKLILSWGKTEQPGSKYYLQKVSHDIFGVVD